MSHIPVLLEESIDFLRIIPGGNYFDGTYGEGGHSNAILKNLNKEGRLFATDLDLGAIEIAKKNMDDNRFSIFHSSFSNIKNLDIPHLDGAVFDFGCHQINWMIHQEDLALKIMDQLICE